MVFYLAPGACVLVDVFWWMRLDLVFLLGRTESCLVFLLGRTESSGVFWGVCELSMISASLYANRWGCVPVLLVVWHGVLVLELAGC